MLLSRPENAGAFNDSFHLSSDSHGGAGMRILMLTQFYPPTIGGEEQHVRNLSLALVARGHHVAVATFSQPGLPAYERDHGIHVYRLHALAATLARLHSDPARRHAPPAPDPAITGALHRLIARERPAIVHAHNWLVHSFLPLKAWSGARLLLTLHDYSLRCAQKRLMFHGTTPCSGPAPAKCLGCALDKYGSLVGLPTLLGTWAMGLPERAAVDMFIPVSTAVAIGNGLAGTALPHTVIPNFVPDRVADPPQGVASFLADLPPEPFLLFVGDLDRDKGVHLLLDAYRTLRHVPPLVLIGRPRASTPTALPPHVLLRTNWPHAAVMAAWQRSLFGIVPSVWPDPCPTVTIEAMATGRAVVAAAIGGLTDQVVEGETGLLVPPGDVGALGGAMARLVEDGELRERLGAGGKEKAREFTAGVVIPRIERLYHTLLTNGAVRSQERMHEIILPNECVPLPSGPSSYPNE